MAGVGSGLANAALARLAVDSVPRDRASMGSGANNTARYIGAALGVAMVVTISNRNTAAAIHPAAQVEALAHGATLAILVSAMLALIAAGLAALARG